MKPQTILVGALIVIILTLFVFGSPIHRCPEEVIVSTDTIPTLAWVISNSHDSEGTSIVKGFMIDDVFYMENIRKDSIGNYDTLMVEIPGHLVMCHRRTK